MGMYDNVRCEYPLPGIADPAKIEFQTKSMDTLFETYRITAEGKLEAEDYDLEDQSDPNAKGFMRFVGSCTRIPKGWNPVDFTGTLNFYGNENSGNLFLISFEGEGSVEMLDENGEPIPRPKAEWFEFDATFDKGTLISVERR